MLLVAVTFAGVPTFVGAEEDVADARAAWEAAVACTGREGKAAAVVPILRGPVEPAWASGATRVTEAGAISIQLRPDAPPAVLAHEVGHAWFHGGSGLLSEGRAEALAACVAGRLGARWAVLEQDFPSLFESLPDLRSWSPSDGTSDFDRRLAYAASRRVFRAARRVVPDARLWDANLDTWGDLVSLLRDDGPAGVLVAEILDDPARLREALLDPDLDGLLTLEEDVVGTASTRWDSDGDGWWDGASPVVGATVVPRDGTAVCLPRVPPGTEDVPIRSGGALSGVGSPGLDTRSVGRGQRMRFPLSWERVGGGIWVAPDVQEGSPLEANPGCGLDPWVTAYGASPAGRDLPALAAAVGAELRALGTHAGRRMMIQVVEEGSTVRELGQAGVVHLVVPVATIRKDPALPSVLASWHVVSRSPLADGGWSLALALAPVALHHGPVAAVNVLPADVRRWRTLLESCEGGWAGALEGHCGSLPR